MSQGKYEKAKEIILEEHLTHIVKKRPATRNAYRIVGLIFIVLGVWLIYMAFNGSGMRMIKAAFGICAILYGCTLFAGSFRPAAYTATYVFSDDGIHMIQKNRTRIISYDSITNINLVIPNPDMPYYIIKLDMGRKNMILPFSGKSGQCDAIYKVLLKKTGIYDEATE